MINKKELLDSLIASHQTRARILSPMWRTIWLFPSLVLINLILMYLWQHYSFTVLVDGSFFYALQLELLSALILFLSLSFYAFKVVIPGEKVQQVLLKTILISGFVFVLSILGMFFYKPSETSLEGIRHFCHMEVFIYGLLGFSLYYFLLRKGVLEYSKTAFWSAAGASALIPATIMQVVCIYEVKHSLAFHYGFAVLAIIFLSLVGLYFYRR